MDDIDALGCWLLAIGYSTTLQVVVSVCAVGIDGANLLDVSRITII